LEHAAHVLGQIGDHSEEAPIVADLGGDQCPEGRRAQHVSPGYHRRFRVSMLVHALVQILDLALGDKRMFGRIIVADQHPHEKPQHANAAEDVEDRGPAIIVQDQTGQHIGEHCAELGTGEHQRTDYRSLLGRGPLRQHGIQRREGRALAQTHKDTQHYQAGRIAPNDCQRRQQREYRGRQDADAEGVLATELLR